MTGLPRRSDSDTFWSGVAFSVKSGARVLGARIAGCCGSGAGLVAMVPDTSGGTNDTQPSRLKRFGGAPADALEADHRRRGAPLERRFEGGHMYPLRPGV